MVIACRIHTPTSKVSDHPVLG